jgi:phage tail sheath protein FI
VGWLNRPELSNVSLGVALTGGTNGLDDFDDSDWIGDSPSLTGIYAADNAYMSMDLMVPGSTSATVYQAMIVYCEDRADMLGYGMIPYGLVPEDAVAWRLGAAPWSHPAFNSHRFSLWYGRPLVYDDLDDTRKWISNLGHLASCLCKTDNDYGSSHAPVGPRRGVVTLVEDIDYDIQTNRRTGYSDLFAENGINYLMMSRYPGIEGAMFWEQRTTQRAPSALRELNVVRFITIMNRMLMPILRTFLFEPNHPVTWREIHRTLEPAFEDWKNKYDIYDYALQTDRDAWFDGGVLKNAVINSGIDIDRGIYHCRALIQPTRTIYYLEFELGVMRTGEAFETFLELKELPGWIRH